MTLTELEKQTKMEKQRGGRPKIAWTRSRVRRACKLYTFTSLKMEDIVKTLEAPGFSPKKRNVETTMFKVLAKIPNRSRTENSRLLSSWRELRKCRQLRRKRGIAIKRLSSQVQKTSPSVCLSTCPKGTRALSQTLSKDAQQIESHKSASTMPPDYLHQVHTGITEEPVEFTYPESWSIDMNDIFGESTRISEQIMSICNSSLSSGQSSMVSYMSSLASRGSSTMGKRGSRTILQIPSIKSQDGRLEHTCHSQEKPRSLQRTQASHEPNVTIDSSTTLSLLSSAEQEVWNQLIDEEALSSSPCQTNELRIRKHLKKPLIFTNMALAPVNCQCEGCESYHCTNLNLNSYTCHCESCESIPSRLFGSGTCDRCGSSVMHRICRDFGRAFSSMKINDRDYFDNTALHYLAERASPNFREIKRLILNGYDPGSRNTGGATFLHVLNWKYVWKLQHIQDPIFQGFVDMVKSLSTWNFNFDDRDYFGRTVAHKAFSAQVAMDEVHVRISTIEQILSVLETNIDEQDIFGVSVNIIICELEDRICDTRIPGVVGESVLPLLTRYDNESILQYEIILDDSEHFLLNEDCGIPHKYACSIDANGDTLLFRALKLWKRKSSEIFLERKIKELLKLGLNVHQRNRDGDTVISVAISQGLPTIVNFLLSEGANPNSEKFHIFRGSDKSQSLLCHAETALARAKRQHNSELYAGILSCINLVMDAGAIATPGLLQRWGNKTIRERIAREEVFSSDIDIR